MDSLGRHFSAYLLGGLFFAYFWKDGLMNHHYIGEHEWGSVVWRLKLLCVQVSLDSQ